jgi:hypothetical protein
MTENVALAFGVAGWRRRGTPLAFLATSLGGHFHMFALSAILIGLVGIFFVRRRSSRKKQQTA